MSQIILVLALFLAIFWSVFLFWRACIHELIESEKAFDIAIVASIGAMITARIFDYVENIETLGLSVTKFIFFNAYGGFDFRGAILGAGVATFLFLRHKKIKTLHVLDLAAAPIVFGQFVFNLARFLHGGLESGKMYAIASISYLLIFVILKRLAARKRHLGFFVCFWLVASSIVDILLMVFSGENKLLSVALGYLIVGFVSWYLFSKRTGVLDIKNLFGIVLLSVFRFKRIIMSIDEAGKFSRSIVLFPLFVSKVMLVVIKLIVKEARLGFLNFMYVLGLKHDRY